MPSVRRLFQALPALRRVQLGLAAALAVTLLLAAGGPSMGEISGKIQELLAADASAKIPWELDADLGLHWAARINAVLLLALLLTARWWLRPWTASAKPPANPKKALPRWCVFAVIAVAILGTALRLPLASKSLWWDELWVIRQCSHGTWKEDTKAAEPGALKFSPTTWKRCAFYYQKPTNHVPMSLLQKASLDVWRKVTGAPRHEFSDLAARLPALALSLAAVVLTAWLLAAWGAAPAAVLAGALLMAVHPLAIRYGVDARAYALVMPLAVSALLAVTRLVRSAGRSTAAWVWLGLNQCLWLWAFPHGLLDVLVMTLLLAAVLGQAQTNWQDRWTVWCRLLVTHVLAGLLFVQLFLPNFTQALRWASQENQGHVLDAVILKDALAQLGTGLRWREPALGTDLGAGLRDLNSLPGPPWVSALCLGLIGLVILATLVARCRRTAAPVWFLAALWFSSVLFACLSHVVEFYYYTRFSIALIPAVALSLTLAWSGWRSLAGRAHGIFLLAWVALALWGGQTLLSRPIEPVRDAAAWLDTAKTGGKTRVLAYGHGREALMVYHPAAAPVEVAAQITEARDSAAAAGETLFVVVGHISFNRALLPSGFAVIENPEWFTEVARFDGIESEHHYRVYRAR